MREILFKAKRVDGQDLIDILRFECSIDPIPPTEEWLLNFGFENIGIDPRKFCDIFYLNGIRLTMSNGGNFYYGQLWIASVHQLQNLYFALTGEELTLTQPNEGVKNKTHHDRKNTDTGQF